MADELPDAPWATPSTDLPDAPWATTNQPPASSIPLAISDVPRQAHETTVDTAKSGASDISSAFPSIADRIKRDAGQGFWEGVGNEVMDVPGRAGRFYRGLATMTGLPMAPLVGAVQSLVGHPLADAEHWIGTKINPEVAAHDDPQAMYDQAKGDVAQSLMAMRPTGFGPKGPLPGAKIPTKAPVPTTQELFDAGSSGFDAARGMGVQIQPKSFENVANTIRDDLAQYGMDENVAGKTFGVLQKLEDGPPRPMDHVAYLMNLRKTLGRLTMSPDGEERYAAGVAKRGVDDFLSNLQPPDLISGDAKLASDVLKDAVGNWSAAERSDLIDKKVVRAQLRASAANSGMNIGNTIRQRLADVLTNEKLTKGMSPDELAQMEGIVNGSITSNTSRLAGNVLGGGGGMGALAAGVVGGPLAPVAGVAARLFSNAVTKSQAGKLGELIRSRSPLSALKNPVPITATVPRVLAADTMVAGASNAKDNRLNVPPAPQTAAAPVMPPVITTKEQYDALPSGAGTREKPFQLTTQAQADWFTKSAPPGSVVMYEGKLYRK